MDLARWPLLIQSVQDREPFVIVLLDGDGMMFKDEYLQRGEQGGHHAAKQLYAVLEHYLAGNFPSLTSPKIMTKLYVNLKGLSDACVRGGIISDPSILDDFVRGFNGSMPLFDLVDIGSKDKAQEKIGGMHVPSSHHADANLLVACRNLPTPFI